MKREPQVDDAKMPKADISYVIRRATDADLAGVLQCLATAFEPYRQEYTRQGFAGTVLNQHALRERMRKMHILVAVSDSMIVGTIGGSFAGKQGHLRGMAVLPEWRGTGVARRLLFAIEMWLAERGCNRVTLDTTLPLKAAMRFYEKNGYVRSGKTSDFFGMVLTEYVKAL
jgi:GNAT superfamily N-acetyltransferase